jgi:MFS family permease
VETKHHRRNTLLLGSVEVGWGFGMALLDDASVLPALLTRLGATYATLAPLPILRYVAGTPFEVLSPYVTENLAKKRLLVWILHCILPCVWGAVGIWLLRGAIEPGPRALVTFYVLWALVQVMMGFLIPLWYDFMGKITDPVKRGSAFSLIFVFQSLAGLAGAVLGGRFLVAEAEFTFKGFALCFLVAFAAAFLSSQSFLGTVEDTSTTPPPRPPLREYLGSIVLYLREDATLRRYVAVRAITRLSPVVGTFYTAQAIGHFENAPVAYFAFVIGAGKLLSMLVSWRFADTHGMKPFLVGGLVALAAAAGLAAFLDAHPFALWPYFLVAGLFGVFQTADSAGNATFVMNLAPEGKRASYLVTVNTALVPLSIGAPLLVGLLADRWHSPAAIQAVAAIVFVVAAVYLATSVPERRPLAA